MRIALLLAVAAAWLHPVPSALAARCECKHLKASSESTGSCTRAETPESCHMAWATKGSGGVVSLSPFHINALEKSNKDLKKLTGSNFNFTITGPSAPFISGPQYLVDTPPAKYAGDESLSPYLLMLDAGMRKIGMNDSLEVAAEITKKKAEVIKALKGDAPLSLGLKDGTLLASKGCLEFARPKGSVMVNTPFSGKAVSCG